MLQQSRHHFDHHLKILDKLLHQRLKTFVEESLVSHMAFQHDHLQIVVNSPTKGFPNNHRWLGSHPQQSVYCQSFYNNENKLYFLYWQVWCALIYCFARYDNFTRSWSSKLGSFILLYDKCWSFMKILNEVVNSGMVARSGMLYGIELGWLIVRVELMCGDKLWC